MTQAVIILLVFFTVLLFVFVFALLLLLKQKCKPELSLEAHGMLIVYATQSGFSEQYAKETAQSIQKLGQACTVFSIEDLTAEHLKQADRVVWMISTYGEGDAPDTAQAFKQWLDSSELDLSHLAFAVLAFGDDRYAAFCAFGQQIYAQLIRLKAQAMFDVVQVNQQSDMDLVHWNSQLSHALGLAFDLPNTVKQWQTLNLTERHLLNAGSQGKGLYHLKFSIPSDLKWHSGDILELRCANSNAELVEFLKAHPNLSQSQIKGLRFKDLNLLNDVDAQNIHTAVEQAADLPLREYSIASIPEQGYLALVVRQEVHEHGLGLGSGLLTQKLALNESAQAVVRSNPAFHLANRNAPCIFIGNGSGIAGLLSHLQQRISENQGENWLIFGERQQQFDALFKDQLETWQSQKMLSKIDLAYSRDAGEYRYVQDALVAQANELKAWIDNGAYIYVCGSLKGMAKGVESVLLDILGQAKLDQLKLEKRYRRDVY